MGSMMTVQQLLSREVQEHVVSGRPGHLEESMWSHNSVLITHLCSEFFCDVVKQRSSDLLLESGVAHHEGNELGRVHPVQVA